MVQSKPHLTTPPSTTRDKVLAAAEQLLREGSAEFSMRDLAAAAGVSFATPFNHFGSKLAIMRTLSDQRIELMHQRAASAALSADTVERVLQVVVIAATVMTETPAVNKAVMAAIGAPGAEPGHVRQHSQDLWARALGDAAGLSSARLDLGCAVLPDHLAIAFRGVLSFWTAGEIRDEDLQSRALAAAAALLFGFAGGAQRDELAALMHTETR